MYLEFNYLSMDKSILKFLSQLFFLKAEISAMGRANT